MGLTLHQWYTADESVAAFGGDTSSERSCDGQFVLLPGVVLCLITLGGTTEDPHVPCPSRFVWRPRRLDYEPSGALPWLPEKVREVWDRSQKPIKKLREHHVFLRTPSDERFIYAGPAHLGSYVSVPGSDVTEVSADFSLNERLPREVWLKFGGYPGWLVEINHRRHPVAADDLAAFERLVNELPRHEFSHLCMTRYEEDSLTVHTNTRRGWLMYLRHLGDSGVYTRDLEYRGDPQSEEVFECVCGIDLEFPASQTLPRERAMECGYRVLSNRTTAPVRSLGAGIAVGPGLPLPRARFAEAPRARKDHPRRRRAGMSRLFLREAARSGSLDMIACYCRVSSARQKTDSQKPEIRRWLQGNGVDPSTVEWFEDKETGRTLKRSAFDRLQQGAFAGAVKTVVVWKLDRLSRRQRDGVNVLADWCERGVRVVVVTQQIDLSGAVGRMVASVLFGLAEIESEYRRERQAAGIAVAKERGVYRGRQRGTTKAPPQRARELRERGLTAQEIATALGVSRRTACRYLTNSPREG